MGNFLSKILPVLFIALFCLILIVIWFRDGKFLATGEDGLMLTNPARSLQLYRYSWVEVRSGVAAPGWMTMLPLFYLELLLLRAGISLWLFQASLFFLLMFIGSVSIYYLTLELLRGSSKDKHVVVGSVSALFYILNPVSLLGIWYRGVAVYSFIFFYALTPLFFYLYVLGLNNRKIVFTILAPISTLILSASFASPGPSLLLWILPFLYSLSFTLTWLPNSKIKFAFFPVAYFVTTFVFWILISLWWLSPYITFSGTTYSSETGIGHAIGTLKANSADFTLGNVIRLIHGGFLYKNEAFGSIYKSPIFVLISWLLPIITIYGLWRLRSNRIKPFFIISFVSLLFLAKGTSSPFGGIFLWLFSHVNILQILRNPFEKVGMLLPTIYAPLFSFGLYHFLSKYHGLKTKIVISSIALASLAAFNWPLFTGAVMKFGSRDIRVEVPTSFREANRAIPTKDHIILSMPIMGGGSGFYKWKYGYKGADASDYLFNSPIINTLYDASSFYGQLLIGMSNGYLNDLTSLAQIFSADVVAFRKDTDMLAFGYNLNALDRSKKMIADAKLMQVFDSGAVSLWLLPKDKIVPVIYAPSSIKLGDSPQELISLLEKKEYDPKTQTFICINKDKCIPYRPLQDLSQIQIATVPEAIKFYKISSVDYEIEVQKSKGRFLLVFNNTYHPGWVISIAGKPVEESKHIIANGYANGFIIDQTGSFLLSLKFAPEEQVYRFSIVSLVSTFLGLLVVFVWLVMKIKINR